VLCVTHLAQIAGFADHHYYVESRPRAGERWRQLKNCRPSSGRARSVACSRASA
jgi:DNA repair ATPase RecN